MEYLLVDLENITPDALAEVPENFFVYVFAGDQQSKLGMDLAESMLDHVGGAKIVRIKGNGKNALDFHIAFFLGKLSEKDPKSSFQILSKDKGFDALVGYLNDKGITSSRVERLSKKPLVKKAFVSKSDSFVDHLKEMSEKVRPKKVAKLKAYLKSWAKKDETMVDPIFNGLLSNGHIEIEGEKVKYFQYPGK